MLRSFANFLILCFIFMCISCKPKHCEIDVDPKLSLNKNLTFAVQKPIKSCNYQVRVNFWADDIHIISKAVMYKKDHSLFLKILEPESKYFKFFDFRLNKNEIQKVKIPFVKGSDAIIDVILQNKYNYGVNETVYQYLILNGYRFFESKMDQVVFVSSKKGFIGNYFRDLEDGDNYIISPAGYILRDIIDYSKSEFRLLR